MRNPQNTITESAAAMATEEDLKKWLAERALEIRPAERTFLRQRALISAAELLARQVVDEAYPPGSIELATLKAELKRLANEAIPEVVADFIRAEWE